MGSPAGYGIDQFGLMVESEPRMAIYAKALEQAITPGCRVIDIGAGFGIFAVLACRFGAGEVIAIEPDPAIELLEPIARANGCADRITVVRDLSTHYVPPAKADVLVSDIRGTTPLFQHHIPTIVDARERLLKPGGRQLPLRDTLRVAPVHAPGHYEACHRPWMENDYGLDLSEGHRFAVNISVPVDLDPGDLLAEPQDLAVLDYGTVTDSDLDATVHFAASRAGTMHGLLVWFRAEIAPGQTFDTGPGAPPLVYRQMLLPLEQAVELAEGERITARIRAQLLGGDYTWSWATRIGGDGSDKPRCDFRQSTFKGRVLQPHRIKPFAHHATPQLTDQIAIDRDCLALVGEGRSFEEIARALTQRHPGHFDNEEAALGHATRLLSRYRN